MLNLIAQFLSSVKVQIFLFCLVVFTIPLKHNYNSIGIILLVIFTLSSFYFKKGNQKLNLKNGKWLILFFFVAVVAMFYTEDIKNGFQYLIKIIPFLLFPVVFSMTKLNQKNRNKIIWSFCISCLIISFILFFANLFTYLDNPNNSSIWNYSGYTKKMDIHPAYYILFLIFNIFFLFEEFLITVSKKKKIFISFSISIFILQVLFLQSRIGIISFLITSIVYVIATFKNIKKKSILMMFMFVSTSLVIAYYFNFLNRFVEIPESLNERITIWEGWWNSYKKSPILGYGTGDAQSALDQGNYFLGNSFFVFYKYNTHNQYLDVLIRLGLIGFSVFLLTLYKSFHTVYKNKNRLLLIFLILISIFFLTENILQRQRGIVFFSFFYLLLNNSNLNEE
ncbi:O-antigen ligase family protein [Aquimarina muelleri]|uniref:O-antigen ligase family protein n=1 Tax=Aquimarina muelleri TaxID=279356 RepID=UPI003F687F6E